MPEPTTILGKALQEVVKSKLWRILSNEIAELYEEAMSKNPKNRNELEIAWAFATEKATSGDYDQAVLAAKSLKPALKLAASGNVESELEVIPEKIVEMAKFRISLWENSRNTLKDRIDAITNSIVEIVSDHYEDEEDPEEKEALGKVLEQAKNELPKEVEGFDTELKNVFDEMIQTEVGKAREKLRKKALELANSYLEVLNVGEKGKFFSDVDNGGGFCKKQSVVKNTIQILTKLKETLEKVSEPTLI